MVGRTAPESAPEMGRRVGIVPAVAPTLTRVSALLDARRAAAALVEAGAGRVVLFGSLVKDRADLASDIDYARRRGRQKPRAML